MSSSSSAGTTGKADIVLGLRLIVSSNRALIQDIERESIGASVPKARVSRLVREDRRGSALFAAGAKLLDL